MLSAAASLSAAATAAARRSLIKRGTRYAVRTLSSSAKNDDDENVLDVLIVGGGAVGATLAKVLGEVSSSLSIGLIERSSSPPPPPQAQDNDSSTSIIPHPRAYALSPHALQLIFGNNDDTKPMLKGKLGYYNEMQVWEQDSPAIIVFSQKDLLGTSVEHVEALGAVVEDAPLVHALWSGFSTDIQTYAPASITSLELPQHPNQELVSVSLKHSDEKDLNLKTRLLVAADGAQSGIRKACGIPWLGWDYGRTAVTFTVALKDEMPKRAYQRFLPNGPLALLPTWSEQYATVVWSTTPQHANQLKTMSSEKLANEINNILQVGPERPPPLMNYNNGSFSFWNGFKYGTEKLIDTLHYGMTMSHWSDSDVAFLVPPTIATVEKPRFAFDLSCRQAKSYTAPRVALVGDAAHTVHPMAGQGLNLGMRDVDCLAKIIREAHDAGMDVGMDYFLEQYNSKRKAHNTMALAGIHALHQVFGVDRNEATATTPQVVLHHAKSLGMGLCNTVGPVRRQLAAVAAGAV